MLNLGLDVDPRLLRLKLRDLTLLDGNNFPKVVNRVGESGHCPWGEPQNEFEQAGDRQTPTNSRG